MPPPARNTTDTKWLLFSASPIFKYDRNVDKRHAINDFILESWSKDESVYWSCYGLHNSGGGQASGTPEIAKYIFNYNKPVVSYTK
jgi:hypothetical protein